jgi:hypothetical protein
MGYKLITNDTFTSIPGLKTWIDGRYGIQLDISGKILMLTDLSPEKNDFENRRSSRRPLYEDVKWVKFLQTTPSQPSSLNSVRRDFKFLHNGSPFGMYGIVNFTFPPATTPIGDYGFFQTGGASSTGALQFLFQNTINNGRIVVIVRNNGATVRTISLSNLTNTGNTNYTVFPQTCLLSHVFLGANKTNNQIMRLNNLVSTSTSTIPLSGYSSADHPSFYVGINANEVDYFKVGIGLIYDWTGYNETQVAAFDLRVRALLTSIQSNFT